MSNIEMESRIREYREMRRMAEEATAAADALADQIKIEMERRGTEELTAGE